MTPKRFKEIVWKHYDEHGRHHLPWRRSVRGKRDPYRVLVSEVMLQQTQVERAIPYYERFIERFPTASALADASLAEVLTLWQGLGYNRRGKMLHDAAKRIVELHGGKTPTDPDALEALPGIGHYTARAVAAFSADAPVAFVETNLRTVVTHHFFPDREQVADGEVLAVLARMLPLPGDARGPREWYAALMDYGAFLKRSGVRLNAKAKGYAKQKAFKGSGREARGALLKELAKGGAARERLLGLLGPDRREQMEAQLEAMLREGMIERSGASFRLPA